MNTFVVILFPDNSLPKIVAVVLVPVSEYIMYTFLLGFSIEKIGYFLVVEGF